MKILIIGSEGYIGSSLKHVLRVSHYVDTCDILPSTLMSNSQHFETNYDNLTKDLISGYDLIFLLAAHSSVGLCVNNPEEAIQNNIVNFMKLLSKMNSNQYLIYASSGSVYDGYNDSNPDENAKIMKSRNIYDFTKISNDFMVSTYDIATIGLRFGTLSGFSPKIRNDLIINKMTSDALNKKSIMISNPTASRSCLGINDLCNAALTMIDSISNISQKTNLFNLCSFNYSIDEIATRIAKITNAKKIYVDDAPTYNFSMSTKKFEQMFKFTFTDTVQSIVNDLIARDVY